MDSATLATSPSRDARCHVAGAILASIVGRFDRSTSLGLAASIGVVRAIDAVTDCFAGWRGTEDTAELLRAILTSFVYVKAGDDSGAMARAAVSAAVHVFDC